MKLFDEVMHLTSTVSSATAFSDCECAQLYACCHYMKPTSNVVEIGCQLGRTSSIIAQVGSDIGYRSIHIDPYTQQFEYLAGWIRMMHGVGNPFTFHCMRTDQVLPNPVSISLLLIDGDHTTHGVEEDCKFAFKTVRVGGLLLAHDYGQPNLPEVKVVLDRIIVEPNWELLNVVDTLAMWRRRGV